MDQSALLASDCEFRRNLAWMGGAVFLRTSSSAKLQRCTFSDNSVASADVHNPTICGGAISAEYCSVLECHDSYFHNNAVNESGEGDSLGGAIHVDARISRSKPVHSQPGAELCSIKGIRPVCSLPSILMTSPMLQVPPYSAKQILPLQNLSISLNPLNNIVYAFQMGSHKVQDSQKKAVRPNAHCRLLVTISCSKHKTATVNSGLRRPALRCC